MSLKSPRLDAIVIGAGLSGLQAAHDVQKAGLSCVVLEARDRVGGKTWSLPCANGKGVVDVGAAWINDTNQSKMFALTKRFGLETITQRTEGNCLAHDVGAFPYGGIPPFLGDDGENMRQVRDKIEELCQKIDLRKPALENYDTMNFEELVRHLGGKEVAFQTARVWTKAMLGCEPSETSALWFLDYCKSGGGLMQTRSDMKHGGQYLRIKKGTQSFSKGLAAALHPGSVLLNTPVTNIQQTPGDCTVITKSGTVFYSKKVILSIPTPLYKDITFTPPLSGAKLALTNSTKLGCTSKMILCYEKPWWRSQDLSGMTQSFRGPYTITRDTSNDSAGHYSLTSMPGADAARAWGTLPAHERRAQILAQVAEIFGNAEEAYRPIEIFEMEWSKEEFSKGCPCPVMPPNALSNWGFALREPFGGVHFVGTETAYEWKGYMEGAVRSGERGAEEVVLALGKLADSGISAKL
ncbi:amine oxidase-4 [Coleophoma crateriformis]|uniref:Amine oxidase n=1 Tax=Coleophoma crateriformis TaxID=565419 RepID=A0A3D8QZ06_9HELO|nr:amine oxidase-4 [Coleophoma crateriformis]